MKWDTLHACLLICFPWDSFIYGLLFYSFVKEECWGAFQLLYYFFKLVKKEYKMWWKPPIYSSMSCKCYSISGWNIFKIF